MEKYILDDMEQNFNRHKKGLKRVQWLSLLIGILLIINGVLFMINPLASTLNLVRLLSFLIIVIGIIRLIRYLSNRIFKSGVFLVVSIIDIVLGIIMLKNIEASTLVFTMIVGFWVLVNGIGQIVISIDLKKFGFEAWWFDLIGGLIGIILGFMLLGDFNLSTFYITLIVSTYMIIFGIAFIVTFFNLKKLFNRVERKYIENK